MHRVPDEGIIPFIWRRWPVWSVVGVGLVVLTVVGVLASRGDKSPEQIISKQLGQKVSGCVETNATGKFTCDLDGSPHCYLFDLSFDDAVAIKEGTAQYADFQVADYGAPPSAYGC